MKSDFSHRFVALFVIAILTASSNSVAAADKTVSLAVRVKDNEGKPLSVAHVNVYQEHRRGSGLIVRPPDYQEDTNASGIARFDVRVKSGEKLQLSIEVSRDDYKGKTEAVDLGTDFPSRILRQFELEPKKETAEKTDATTTFTIKVIRKDNQEPVDGAKIEVTSFGGFTPKHFSAQSDGSGKAVIVAPLNNDFSVRASKEQFGEHTETIKTGDNYQKEFTLVLPLERKSGTVVSITVRDAETRNAVGDADVVLDGITSAGYHSATTDGSGHATLVVPEMGRYTVRISQEYYERFQDEARLLQGEETKQLEFALQPKPKKDEGKDTIQVTVLAKDPTDQKAKPSPVSGAMVKAGSRGGVTTDGSGEATLNGTFEASQEVGVEAQGYKSQTRNVGVKKLARYSGGTGQATFLLDPDLSENTPIRLIVEVRGPDGRPIKDAGVDFILPPSQLVGGRATDRNGETDFRNSDASGVALSEFRKGLLISVKAEGYKQVTNRSVPSDLMQPSNEARRFTVQLEKDWSALANDIAGLEAHIAAWETDARAAPLKAAEPQFFDNALSSVRQAEQSLKEIEAAREAFGIALGPGGAATTRCRKAAKLKEAVQSYEKEANQKAEELKRLLDEATGIVSRCSEAGDAEHIRQNYRAAIKLVGQIGVLEKKAVKDRNELSLLIQEGLALKKLLPEIEAKFTIISDSVKTAEQTEQKARAEYRHHNDVAKGLTGRFVTLKAELAVLEVKHDVDKAQIPADLRKRIDAIRRKLDRSNSMATTSGELKSLPDNIANAPIAVRSMQSQAEKIVSQYRAATCDIEGVDQIIEGMGTTLSNASMEIGLAANLPNEADACAQKVAAANDVEVPDLSVFDNVSEMKMALTHVGLKGAFSAKGKPPSKEKEFKLGGQSPAAGTRVKKDSTVNVSIYQKFDDVAAATPTPADDAVSVPNLAAFDNVSEMKVALAHNGLIGAFSAKGKPPSKEKEFKFAGQSPAADTKVKRGSTVTVSIYQKFEDVASAEAASEEVVVPSLAAFDNVSEMKVALGHVGLKGAFSAKGKPPAKEMEFKFAGQSPGAGTKVKNGSIVGVSIYQKFEESASAPAEPAAGDEVVVPSLAVFDNVSEMKVALAQNGLVGSFSAKATPPSKEKEFKFAGQSPAADTKVKRGSTVAVSIYQKFEETATAPEEAAAGGEVVVPSLAVFDNVSEMKVALAQNGLVGSFSATGIPPSKELEFKFADQSPAADTRVKRGSTVSVAVYGKFEGVSEASESEDAAPSEPRTAVGAMPNLIGLTVREAASRLSSNMQIRAERGEIVPLYSAQVSRVYEQDPPAGAKIAINAQIVVRVRHYWSGPSVSRPIGDGRRAPTMEELRESRRKRP